MWTALWEDGHVSWWMRELFDEQFAVLDSSNLQDPVAGQNLPDAPAERSDRSCP